MQEKLHWYEGTRKAIDANGTPIADRVVVVEAGLRKLEGNTKPYFSVTGGMKHVGRIDPDNWGAQKALLLRHWPELEPVITLHLADIDGVPMHAHANGLYWIVGALGGGLGQRFSGSTGHYGKNPKACEKILSEHLRVSPAEAEVLSKEWFALGRGRAHALSCANGKAGATEAEIGIAISGALRSWIEERLPTWKAEATAAIETLDRLRASI